MSARASERAPVRNPRLVSAATVVLALLAPVSGFLAIRLLIGVVPIFNFLGLPWPPVVRWGIWALSAAIVTAAWVMAVRSTTRPETRKAGVFGLVWISLGIVLGFFLFFLSIYGDPAGPRQTF